MMFRQFFDINDDAVPDFRHSFYRKTDPSIGGEVSTIIVVPPYYFRPWLSIYFPLLTLIVVNKITISF